METPKFTYIYFPNESRLVILRNGKISGGFTGDAAEKLFHDMLESGADVHIGGTTMEKNRKVRQLRALWIKQGCDEFRGAILEPYFVTSTKDLTEKQLDELIARFSHTNKSDAPKEIRINRSLNLKLLQELGKLDNDGDWTKVNSYLMSKSIAGKLLFQMDIDELKALTKKLRAILDKERSVKIEVKRLSTNN